jgi:hypothetical protein
MIVSLEDDGNMMPDPRTRALTEVNALEILD